MDSKNNNTNLKRSEPIYSLKHDYFKLEELYKQVCNDFFSVRPPQHNSKEIKFINNHPELLHNISYINRMKKRNENNAYEEALNTLLLNPGELNKEPVPDMKGFYLFIRNNPFKSEILDIYIGI